MHNKSSITERIIEKFAPGFYNDFKTYKQGYYRKKEEIIHFKAENLRLKRVIEAVNNITNRGDRIIKITNDHLVIFQECDKDIVLTDRVSPYNNNWQAKILCGWNMEKKSIYIEDNHANPKNQGYGSKAMEVLIEEARKNGINTITGWLSPVDTQGEENKENADMLRHFYKKHGFTIEYQNGKEIVTKKIEK